MMAVDHREGAMLLLDKPLGWTSFDVVNKVRYALCRAYGQKKFKVGHAGTLDPLATGLLILCTGRYTKKINEFMGLDKTYTGTIQLGASTASYDKETPVDQTFPTENLTEEAITEALSGMIGHQEQIPPSYSAKKVGGKAAYILARKGKAEELKLRKNDILIHDLQPTRVEIPEVDFWVHCSKGTYVRSLAHDLGVKLNNGAHLTALRRHTIGDYSLEDAQTVDTLIEELQQMERPAKLPSDRS